MALASSSSSGRTPPKRSVHESYGCERAIARHRPAVHAGLRGGGAQHLGILTVQNMRQPVETLSGGQCQAVALARAAAFGSRLVTLDEPAAALGVRESGRVLDLIRQVSDRGLPFTTSHNMAQVFEIADRIRIQRLGGRAALVTPRSHAMAEAAAIMAGAVTFESAG